MVAGSTTTYAISATITPNIVRVRIPLMRGLFDTTFIFHVIKFVCDLQMTVAIRLISAPKCTSFVS
jgi:hypothetical protein